MKFTFCEASSSSFLFFSRCLLKVPVCPLLEVTRSSSARIVDDFAFSYSSWRWMYNKFAFLWVVSASCCQINKRFLIFINCIYIKNKWASSKFYFKENEEWYHFSLLPLPLFFNFFTLLVKLISSQQKRL